MISAAAAAAAATALDKLCPHKAVDREHTPTASTATSTHTDTHGGTSVLIALCFVLTIHEPTCYHYYNDALLPMLSSPNWRA